MAFESIDPDERGISVCWALLQAVRYYCCLDAHFERMLTDNGARSRSFRRLVRRLGLRHLHTRPYSPRTNGKDENCPWHVEAVEFYLGRAELTY